MRKYDGKTHWVTGIFTSDSRDGGLRIAAQPFCRFGLIIVPDNEKTQQNTYQDGDTF